MASTSNQPKWQVLNHSVSEVFTPAAPVNESALFAGRNDQLNKVIDAANQRGQHAIIYGERGVGKTSLANILSSRMVTKGGEGILAPHVNCNSVQTYGDIWLDAFDQIEISKERRIGFSDDVANTVLPPMLPPDVEDITPGKVCAALTKVADMQNLKPTLIVLDEFDRVPNGDIKRAVADTIKTLSDRAVHVTIVVVGVADTIGNLIHEHQSIERAITQVHMPRMETSELYEVLDNGMTRLGMTISQGAKQRIADLSHGLPSYTHSLALRSTRTAIRSRRTTIRQEDVRTAVTSVVNDTGASLADAYRQAIVSTRGESLFRQVILACACAETDPFGFFATGDVRKPMSDIMGKRYDIPSFARHLKQFCEEHRGPVLRQYGVKRRYRYRFINPLMQPFVIMNGIESNLLRDDRSIIEGEGSSKQRRDVYADSPMCPQT